MTMATNVSNATFEKTISDSMLKATQLVEKWITANPIGSAIDVEINRREIVVGEMVSLCSDFAFDVSSGLSVGEVGVVTAVMENGSVRVKSQKGSEHIFSAMSLKVYPRQSRAVSLLVESVYFPALAEMLFQACETTPSIKTVLLRQLAAFASQLRPLEMHRELGYHEILRRVWKFLIKIVREQHEGADDALDSLISIACAAGSIAFDIDLGLLFCARPRLATAKIKNLGKLTLGISSLETDAQRTQEFSRDLQQYIDGGGVCSPAQACAAVLSRVEEFLSVAERKRLHRSGEDIAHVSEAGALARLLNFIDFAGGTHCTLADPDLALATIDADGSLQAVVDMAAKAHAASIQVCGTERPSEGGADNHAAIRLICRCAFRLLVANLALRVNLKGASNSPILERSRILLNFILERAPYSSFFGEMRAEGRDEIRALALVAYDTAGESFFRNSSTMLKVLREMLQSRISPSSKSNPTNGGIVVAVLRIFGRPSVMLPLLLEKEEEVKSVLKDVVDIVHQIRFDEMCGKIWKKSGFDDSSTETFSAPSTQVMKEATWNWSLCHRGSIQLSKDDRHVSKTNSSPDYSCAMSSEPFVEGVHSWEIRFESTGSTWVGVAGESTKNHLGSSPTVEYGVTLHNSGSWNFYGGLSATMQENAPFNNNSVVKAELDFEHGTLDMWVDGMHKLSISNITSKALHAYVCMDNTGECFELTSATIKELTAQNQSVLDAVVSVSSSTIKLEAGIYGHSITQNRLHSYGVRIIDLLNSRLKEIAADIGQGKCDQQLILKSFEETATQSCLEEIFVLAQQICCSPLLAGELRSLSCMIQSVHAVSSKLNLPLEHGLQLHLRALVKAVGPKIKTFIWGEPIDENLEKSNEDWLKSAIFSKGLLTVPSNLIQLMVPQESKLRHVVSLPTCCCPVVSPDGTSGLDDAGVNNQPGFAGKRKAPEPQSEGTQRSMLIGQGEGEGMHAQSWAVQEGGEMALDGAVFDKMIQPRIAVHISPYLDLLERNVIIALLYHFGVLDSIVSSGAQRTEDIVHLCQDASFIARQIRKNVMENRSFANQSLRDGTAPKDWDFFVKPIMDKCILLMQTPPMCPPSVTVQTNSQRKLQTAAMLVKKGLSATPAEEEKPCDWDTVVTAVQAHQVFKRMQLQSVTSTPLSNAKTYISRFFRDTEVSAESVRQRLLDASILSPGLQGCLAFDTIKSIISLSDVSLLDTALLAIWQTKKHKQTLKNQQTSQASLATSGYPENWGMHIARTLVSSNTSGISKLFDGKTGTYWQSSGSCPHWIQMFIDNDDPSLTGLGIIVSSEDQSYCPLQIATYIGDSASTLQKISSVNVQPVGSRPFALEISLDSSCQIKIIKISIESNQQGGCDTRVRGVFLRTVPKRTSVWTVNHEYQIFKQIHYLDAGKGSYIPELRVRFNECMRALFELVTRDDVGPGSLMTSVLNFMSIKMDSVDIDFLACCSLNILFETVWRSLERQLQSRLGEIISPDSCLLDTYAAYGRFLVSTLENIIRVGEQASPILANWTMDAIFSAIQSTVSLLSTCSEDCKVHLEQFVNLVLPSIKLAKSSLRIMLPLQSCQWLDLLWEVAASKTIQDLRLCALCILRDLALNQMALGSYSSQFVRKALALVIDSSPERCLYSSDVRLGPDTKVRREALFLVSCMLQSPHLRQLTLQEIIDGLNHAASSELFMASVMTFGGTLDSNAREKHVLSNQKENVIGLFSEDAVGHLVRSCNALLASLQAANLEEADLTLIVASTRIVKALWELPALQRGKFITNELFSLLIKIAIEPCPVPFSCVSENAISQKSKHLWKWGPVEPRNMVISDDGLTVRNKSGSSPDYSCALGSQIFKDGIHSWEIEVRDVRSMWLGIARGIEEAGGLASSPGRGEFLLCFASGGGTATSGMSAAVETVGSSGYSSGNRVRFELNIPDRELKVSVDGSLRYVCTNVDCEKGVVPYLCSDYNESATIVHRSFSSGLDGKELTLDMFVSKLHAVIPTLSSSMFTRIEAFLNNLDDEYGPESIADAKRKLESAGITLNDLYSPSLTKERLRSVGISLGLRTSILKKRDSELCLLSARSNLMKSRRHTHACQMLPMSVLGEHKLTDVEAGLGKVADSDFVQNSLPRLPTNRNIMKDVGKPLTWATRGSSYHLVLDVELALLSNYARLLVYDLLSSGDGRGLDASTLELLLIRSFRSSRDPRPRMVSLELSEDRMECILFRAIQGWTKSAEQCEIEKLRTVCLRAISRFSAQLCKAQESTSSNVEPSHEVQSNAEPGHEVQISFSEGDSEQAGIGTALMILLSLANAGLPFADLIEYLAKCMVLSPADSCHAVISSVAQVLQRLESSEFTLGPEMRKTAQMFRNAVVAMIQAEAPKLSPGTLHSRYLQNLIDSVSQLEILSADSFDSQGKLSWEFTGQVPKELQVIFHEDTELAAALAKIKISSFRDLSVLEDSVLESLSITKGQKEVVRSLKLFDTREFYLPGDVVGVASLAGKSLEFLLTQLETRNVPEVMQNLENEAITVDTLRSPSLTVEQLKAAGLPLGVRKAILSWREREHTPWKVVSVRENVIFAIKSDSLGTREVHFCSMSLIEGGPLSSALSEMGFHDRESISIALQMLKLGSFSSGLDSSEGQKILDLLTSGSVENVQDDGNDSEDNQSEDHGSTGNTASSSGVKSGDSKVKAKEQVDNYAAVLAILRCLRLQKPFPLFFEVEIRRSLKSKSSMPKTEGADHVMTDQYFLSDTEFHQGLDNSMWTKELDAVMVLLLAEGKPVRYDQQNIQELCAVVEKNARLSRFPVGAVATRLNMLAILRQRMMTIVPLIDLDSDGRCRGFLVKELCESHERVPTSAFSGLFRALVSDAQRKNSGNVPSLVVNRGTVPAAQRKRHNSVFYQIFQQIGVGPSKASLCGFSGSDAGKRFWTVSFQGEGGIDGGGLFRDSLREICAELQSEGTLKLLIPWPNRLRAGAGQTKWLVNPVLTDEEHLAMYEFVGTIMGASLLRGASLELDLAGLVWKQLLGQRASWSDLEEADEAFCRAVTADRAASETEWLAKSRTWTVVMSTGQRAELRQGGLKTMVSFAERDAYLDACVAYRLREGRLQVEAMRTGFLRLVPGCCLELIEWTVVERLVCGTPIIDVSALKKMTEYDSSLAGGEGHPVAVLFWQVMAALPNDDRAQVMAFAWGRRRLPPQNDGVRFKLCLDQSLDDRHLPRSHTCFFTLDLPRYTSANTLRKKLLYAAHHCSTIDNDRAAHGRLLADNDGMEEAERDCQEGTEISVLPFEKDTALPANDQGLADGGHKPFLPSGSRALAAAVPGGAKLPCTVIGPADAAAGWCTCPARYAVKWDGKDQGKECIVAEKDIVHKT